MLQSGETLKHRPLWRGVEQCQFGSSTGGFESCGRLPRCFSGAGVGTTSGTGGAAGADALKKLKDNHEEDARDIHSQLETLEVQTKNPSVLPTV